ncbi:MAG: LacI family transcriptional regulator [Opitutales bacterium]|nr:LacI family transcriptional regulator [Opitutales bacterium]
MMVNQQQIAESLGISRTTVSRCFTNHPGINPDTRASVFSLASKLGYNYLEPRSNGKQGSRPSLKTIAVLICSAVDEYNRSNYESPGFQLLPGISEYAQLNKLQLDIHTIDPKEDNLDKGIYKKLLKDKKSLWDGALLVYPFPVKVIQGLMRLIPCVSLVEQFGAQDLDCIDVDHHRGVSHLIQRLIDKGHRRIGFFSRRYSVEPLWVYRRFSAFVERLTSAGLQYRSEDVLNLYRDDTYTLEESYQKAIQQTKDGVTAWICPADHIAYDFISVFNQYGLIAGKDYSITGFDGVPSLASQFRLTTIQIPYRGIGFQAARRLNDLIENRFSATQHVYLNGKIVAGNSDAQIASIAQ